MPDTKVVWTPDKSLSPAERTLLLRILFGPQARRRNLRKTDGVSHSLDNLEVDTNAPAAAGTAPGLAD